MSELVKNSSAVAVDESLTTLLDWTNIESLSGFTIMVENAGGGSANDITDIQIDTSVDGGVTVLTDQHADTPAVPIADGSTAKGTFTETAAFVRVRALCAAGEDTTANAWLLADSATGRICTLADIRDRLGLADGDTDNDALLNRILVGIEDMFSSYTGRELILNAAAVTEYFTGCGSRLLINRYPIVSVTSIIESYDYSFTETALTANSDYRLVGGGKNGIIYRMNMNWPDTEDIIQIIYKGGCCAAGQTPGDGEFAMPADLREAAIEQASFIYKRKDDIGLSAVSFDGGGVQKFSAMKLLPLVEQTLKKYKRPCL